MTTVFGGLGVSPTLRGQPSNVFSLVAGQTRLVPAGTWRISSGSSNGIIGVSNAAVQEYDPISTIWRPVGGGSIGGIGTYVNSDGVNYRIANLTGCVIGVNVTTAGSGYTSAPVVTDSGSSVVINSYTPIIGGLVSTSVTVTNGGKNYTYAPQILIDAPPTPGVQATATCTVSAGAVATITIINQGAGYTNIPQVYVVPDPRDSTGTGASAQATLTGAGTVAVVLVNPGSPIVTSATTTAPVLTFAGGGGSSAAATALMCWTTTAYTVTSAGSNISGNVLGLGYPQAIAASSSTNPEVQSGLLSSRPASYDVATGGGFITTTGQTVYDGGLFPGVPKGYVAGFATTSFAQIGFTLGTSVETVTLLAV